MLPLNSHKWKELEGGYKIHYDASVPLNKLETANSSEAELILEELMEELHHQGDVGLASYYAVPHLIRIGLANNLTNWQLMGLVVTIELARHENNNPPLPEELKKDYHNSLDNIIELVKLNTNWDRTYSCCALAAIAISKGQLDIARVIIELEDIDLSNKFKEFMENL